MIRIKARDMHRKDPPLTIKGGWMIKVPEVEMREAEQEAYVKYLNKAHGMSPITASKVVSEATQRAFTTAFKQKLRDMLFTRADEYVAMYGDLRGFDPERLQAAYVPGENTGRAGKPVVRRLLQLMREEADDD